MTGAALPVDSGWTAHGPCSASMPRNALPLRREANYEATMRALMQAPWQGKFDLIEGVILHESMPEHAMAAE
jgi:hypothetical protein